MRARAGAAALALVIVLIAGACGRPGAAPEIRVLDAYTIPGESTVAVYLTLVNDGAADRMVGAELVGADAGRARVELHEMAVRDGLSIMRRVEAIDVAAGARTELAPGGDHLMLEDLRVPVALGDTLSLLIRFERSEPIQAAVEVVTVDDALDRPRHAAPDHHP